MALSLIPTGGRYPYCLAKYDPANIRAALTIHQDTVVLRIDDVENADRWEEFIISRDVLLKALRENLPASAE